MPDAIPPALTPEEWESVRRVEARYIFENDDDSTDGCFAAVAAWNSLLPDDDPRKITRADVTMLDHVAYEYAIVIPLLAKLAALLPPEP